MAVLGPHEAAPAKDTLLLAQDLNYAKHLAANDENERRRALKYLKKYLDQRSKACPLSEESLQVLWKGLFFTMWMSDLPLVQEECAESIAHLMHALPLAEAMRFFKEGLTMLQNEWQGIDQLRLNKFLMLVRRLLRQALVALKGNNFRKQSNDLFAAALEETVLRSGDAAPLGLVMHFTEVFLEEVAKIADGKLQPSRTIDLLKPFVRLLAFAQDKRVIDWVVKFIFTHLMKQHKLGLEYQEKYRVWKQQGFAGSINQVQKVLVEDEGDEAPQPSRELDPRAGRVDVELPPILFNAKELAEALQQPKGDPRTSKRTRTQLNVWAAKFLKLHSGVYPLGLKKLPQSSRKRKGDGDVDMNPTRAAKRLIRFEQRLMGQPRKRPRTRERPPKAPAKKRRIEKKQPIKGDFVIKHDWGVWHVSAAEPLKRPQAPPSKLRGKGRVAKPLHSPSGPRRKRVVINTRLNSSQNITEHIQKVQASPQPPWDSTRKPGKPVLKSPVRPSPINPFYKLRTV
ncbi:ribosomal RNA processing protein 1 homolog [Dendroctonus ponderosae]